MRTGFADLPLHAGRCPPWLFVRMKALGAAITGAIVEEHGEAEFLRRISNPFFFQSLGCVLGFDWHSSGVTTTVCGALKEGLVLEEHGIEVAGGKGKVSRNAPVEIMGIAEEAGLDGDSLVKASKLSAKVDSAAVQDGFQLYHHCFFVSREGKWAVVQQGLKAPEHATLDWLGAINGGHARRYHWLSEGVESFVEEPHAAICCDERRGNGNETIEGDGAASVLNMVALESRGARKGSVDALNDGDYRRFLSGQMTLESFENQPNAREPFPPRLGMPRGHLVDLKQYRALEEMRKFQPRDYEELVALKGMGPKAVRALALVAELVYGQEPSWRDPAKYSFAHGGKDGTPRPVDRGLMFESARFIEAAVDESRLGSGDKRACLARLSNWLS